MTDNFNLLNNSPIEDLSSETDYFGTLKKAQAIEHFLSNCFKDKNEKIDKNLKMISLYGNWGSGKSSVIKYLEKNLSKGVFKTIFFEAWQHENDENLILSLSECLSFNQEKVIGDIGKNFVSSTYLLFKSLLSSISISIPILPPIDEKGSSSLSIKPIDSIKSAEENIKKQYESISFFNRLERFKDSFIKLETSILNGGDKKNIIVFIDDLDRCEPEHVIDILSAIKNFFIYGEKTIFFCALDKDAVTKAIQTKYKDVIKADEYLEKIFDVSFNMPSNFSIEKLLENYFSGNLKNPTLEFGDISITKELALFFEFIGFTNPRHLKKVLNKYEILRSFKSFNDLDGEYKNLIPNILSKNKPEEGSFFETILTLYIIILYEFYNEKFIDLENYDGKIKSYILKMETNPTTYYNNSTTIKSFLKFEYVLNLFLFPKLLDINKINQYQIDYKRELFFYFLKFLSLFLPSSNEKFYFDINKMNEVINNMNQHQGQKNIVESIRIFSHTFIEQFNNKENAILYSFTKYFINLVLEKNHLIDIKSLNYEFKNLFVMARDLL